MFNNFQTLFIKSDFHRERVMTQAVGDFKDLIYMTTLVAVNLKSFSKQIFRKTNSTRAHIWSTPNIQKYGFEIGEVKYYFQHHIVIIAEKFT